MAAAGSGTWQHQEQVATGLQNGTAPLPYPAIAWTDSSVVITATDSDGNIYYWWQQAASSDWNKEHVFQGLFSGAETAPLPQNSSVAWTGASVVVAGTDGAGSLYYWWQQAGSGDWHQERVGEAGVNP